jgi:hypothetical protein
LIGWKERKIIDLLKDLTEHWKIKVRIKVRCVFGSLMVCLMEKEYVN